MADIRTILNKILSASLGRDVRQAIHDGIETCYADGKAGAIDLIARQEVNVLDARMDSFASLPAGSTSGDAELADIRVDANGTIHDSAGKAVRSQVGGLKSDLTSETNARVNADNALSARITNKVAQPLDGNNQPTNGTSGQSLRTKGDGTTEWASVGLPTCAQTADAVSTWLNEHPEATTTVQDGSLTYQKFVIGTLGYVTPEMFGAKANDNSFDNAEAFTNAINSGYPVKSFGGTYYFATELIIQNKTGADLDFTPSTFVYTGTEYLINFIALRASTIRLGVINALSGGAIRFTGENSDSWSQYDNVYFREIRANTDCIFIEQKEGGYWCNEINFHNGRFISGDVGLHIMLSSTTDANSHVNTYNIGVEGVTTGFFFENLSDGSKAIRHGMFVNTRFEESFTYLARSVGVVTSMLFISPYSPNANMLSVSGLSDGWQFVDSTRGNQCTVINGEFYAYGIPQLTYGGRGLAENTDLNDIVECGSYYVATVATAQTILNKPNINEVFRLNVISLSGGDVRGEWMNKKQIIEYRNHRYSRYITSDGSGNRTYSAWKADMSNVAPSVLTAPITAGADIAFNSYTKAVYDEKMVMLHLDFTTSAGIPAWQTLFTLAENIRPQATRNCSMNGISGTAFVNIDGAVANSSGIPTGSHIVADLIYFL